MKQLVLEGNLVHTMLSAAKDAVELYDVEREYGDDPEHGWYDGISNDAKEFAEYACRLLLMLADKSGKTPKPKDLFEHEPVPTPLFTLDIFREAYKRGIVRFSTSTDLSPICVIGDNANWFWHSSSFYFAGNEGEGMTWQEYMNVVGVDTMLAEAFEVLNEELDADERANYIYYIRERLED